MGRARKQQGEQEKPRRWTISYGVMTDEWTGDDVGFCGNIVGWSVVSLGTSIPEGFEERNARLANEDGRMY